MARASLIACAVAAAAALCLLQFAGVSAEENKEAEKACGSGMLGKLEGCCKNIPRVINKEAFVNCIGEKKAKESKSKQSTKRGKRAIKRKSGSSKKGGAMCLMECVLKNQSLANAAGEPDANMIKQKFLEISDATWKPIVESAVKNCSDEYSSVNKEVVAASNISECKPSAALFMTCVRRFLALSCPSTSMNKDDKKCDATLKQLQTCDPFVLKKGSERKGKKKYSGSKSGKKSDKADKLGKDMKSGKAAAADKKEKAQDKKAMKADKKKTPKPMTTASGGK